MVLLPVLIAVGAFVVVLRVVEQEQEALRRHATITERAGQAERLNAESAPPGWSAAISSRQAPSC